MNKLREPRITAKDLIEVDWGIKKPVELAFELPTLDRVILFLELKSEGFPLKEKDISPFYLDLLLLQLLLIPAATTEFAECLKKFRRGPGERLRELVTQLRQSGPSLVTGQQQAFAAEFTCIKLASELGNIIEKDFNDIFSPWIQRHGNGKSALALPIIKMVGSVTGLEEVFGGSRTRNRISMRIIKAVQTFVWGKPLPKEERLIDKPHREKLIEMVAECFGKPISESWRLRLSSERNPSQKTDRENARRTLKGAHVKSIEPRTAYRAVWCFTKLVILGKEQDPYKELLRLNDDKYRFPFEELHRADKHDLGRYMKPVVDAIEWEPSDAQLPMLLTNLTE